METVVGTCFASAIDMIQNWRGYIFPTVALKRVSQRCDTEPYSSGFVKIIRETLSVAFMSEPIRQLENRMTCRRRAAFLGCMLGFISIALPGCSYLGNQGRAKEVARGQKLFQMHCGGCHNGKQLAVGKQPPVLDGIFQRPSLPSGAPATDAQVRATILEGRSGIMPPFQNALDSQDIADIIEYLHSLKGSQRPESTDSAFR